MEEEGFIKELNPDSLKTKKGFAEPSLANPKINERFQFQRKGYFVVDKDSTKGAVVFNKTVALRDTWKK